jgi:hypothetical protein
MGQVILKEQATPVTPPLDKVSIYPKAGGGVYKLDDSGTEVKIITLPVVTTDIADDAVTYAKIQNISATDKLLGRVTAGAGDVEEIACTAAGRAILDDADAATQRTTLGAAKSGANTDITSLKAVTLEAGTIAAGTSPLKFTAGVLNTTPELGAMEFTDDGTTGKIYITVNVAGILTRKEIAFV